MKDKQAAIVMRLSLLLSARKFVAAVVLNHLKIPRYVFMT